MSTHLDLCSGIGGFALAAQWAGYTTIGFCEIDPFCQQVLAKNFPEVPIHADLKTLDGGTVRGWLETANGLADADGGRNGAEQQQKPPAPTHRQTGRDRQRGNAGGIRLDILTAGYPCQPFSQAGKRLGEEDDRHLWPAIAALVADLKPAQCLFENVAGHVTLGLDRVLADLEALGYACGAVVVPACAVNAPHRRDRVWIMAHAERQLTEQPQGIRDGGIRRGGAPGQTGLAALGGEVVADANDTGRREQRRTVAGEPEHAAAQLSGWWEVEPELVRVAHGISNRAHRLRALGNAIVPAVAYEIIEAMKAAA